MNTLRILAVLAAVGAGLAFCLLAPPVWVAAALVLTLAALVVAAVLIHPGDD